MKSKQPIKPVQKRAYTYGKPVYKPTISVILDCDCGGKYIKTRVGQTTCIMCLSRPQKAA